jgi:hypothetical protein
MHLNIHASFTIAMQQHDDHMFVSTLAQHFTIKGHLAMSSRSKKQTNALLKEMKELSKRYLDCVIVITTHRCPNPSNHLTQL